MPSNAFEWLSLVVFVVATPVFLWFAFRHWRGHHNKRERMG